MKLLEAVKEAESIGIAGHLRPDGDCIGSVLGLYNYLQDVYNQNKDKTIDVYAEFIPNEFSFLKSQEQIKTEYPDRVPYDVFVSLDCGSIDRLGEAEKYFLSAKKTFCIDHHISNTAFAMANIVKTEASSTAEVLFDLLDYEKISTKTAECLYLGIIHDTGVFKYSCTSEKTMIIAGKLMAKGVSPTQVIDETFYQKTFVQNQILGRCLLESILLMDGKVIVSSISRKMQDFYGITHKDLKGVIDQLRVTKGVEVAIFVREEGSQSYKVSMRSNGDVNVSKIAVYFGGGGHVKAAGCSMSGSLHDVINNLTAWIEYQINQG